MKDGRQGAILQRHKVKQDKRTAGETDMTEFNYDIVKDPEIFRQNRLDAHSDHEYYGSLDELMAQE